MQAALDLPRHPTRPDWRPEAPPDLSHISEIAIDTETRGLKWWTGDILLGMAVGWREGERYRTQYLPIRHAGQNLDEGTVRRWFQREVRNKRVVNLKTSFDSHVIDSWGESFEAQGCTLGDVGHYAALLDDHRKRFSLEILSQAYLGRGKIEGLDVNRMREYHGGDVDEYARRDVELALALEDKMRPMLAEQDLLRVAALEDACIYPVCEMERNGAPLDEELLSKWVIESEREYLTLLEKFQRLAGFPADPGRREDLQRIFHDRNVAITEWTRTGLPSFSDAILRGVKDECVVAMREVRRLDSLRNKFITPYWHEFKRHGLLRYALHQLRTDEGGTISGRFSSSSIKTEDERVGVNVQQVKSVKRHLEEFGERYQPRALFVARNGSVYAADAEQIEYRLFGHFSKSEQIISAYRENPRVDFHELVRGMISRVRGITRKRAKDVNFAKVYGAGLHKISIMLGLSVDEARPFVSAYDQAFPEAGRTLRQAMDVAERRGYVRTILGRRTRFPDKTRIHKALNGVIQGSAADVMKQKLVELHRRRRETGFTMRFTVHDEVVGDVPDQHSANMVTAILDSQSFDTRVPILWSAGVGANWRECD